MPEKAVFAFLGDTVENFARDNGCEQIAYFDSITKIYPVFKTVYRGEEICFCQAPCGAAPAVQILEFLIECGTRYIISCGSCGALQPFEENEIIIPISAMRDEGTSYHYIEPSRFIQLNPMAIEAIKKACDETGVPYTECVTWTTDGFYRETREMVKYRMEEGCQVVEMECSALAACAQFRNVVFGQILFTADTLAALDMYVERGWGKSSYEKVLDLSFRALSYL